MTPPPWRRTIRAWTRGSVRASWSSHGCTCASRPPQRTVRRRRREQQEGRGSNKIQPKTPPQHNADMRKVEELREALRHTHFWAHPPHREWLTGRTLLRFLIAVRLHRPGVPHRTLSPPAFDFGLPRLPTHTIRRPAGPPKPNHISASSRWTRPWRCCRRLWPGGGPGSPTRYGRRWRR